MDPHPGEMMHEGTGWRECFKRIMNHSYFSWWHVDTLKRSLSTKKRVFRRFFHMWIKESRDIHHWAANVSGHKSKRSCFCKYAAREETSSERRREFHHTTLFWESGQWDVIVWPSAYKYELAGESGRECLHGDSLSLHQALRSVPGHVSVYTAAANQLKDLSLKLRPLTGWREAIKLPGRLKRRIKRRHEREAQQCVLPKHGVHWLYEAKRAEHREEGKDVSSSHSCADLNLLTYDWLTVLISGGKTGETD